MRDCVSCQDTFALKGQDQAARACAYHIRVSQVKLAALPSPEEVGGGAGDLCAAAQLPFSGAGG